MGVTLITGGARSGKSLHAENLAKSVTGQPFYIFTADIRDAEMQARVTQHQQRRGDAWREHHAPRDLVAGLQACVGDGARLVDCLTLWLSNLLMAEADIEEHTADLLGAITGSPIPLAIVTNEVGLGIVPEHPLGRRFRDAAGRLNQAIAHHMDENYLVAAGHVLPLQRFS